MTWTAPGCVAMSWCLVLVAALTVAASRLALTGADECKLTPVVHVLQYPGCVPKPIPSYACVGHCTSYVQVSGSKLWQTERSCMCCQESGQREASVSIFCPKAKQSDQKFRKIVTRAPVECMCRPCTQAEESKAIPQEVAGFVSGGMSLESMPFV
ncbi:bursicon-like isoform X1 [Amphibalanus amphitrite]|uniref:bursicon-like isoform X1 n=1 Tax=Amphibalanus amphitrite TaxID=1232801 RepID=UPI001C90E537|nr:bursicon-like isoform X1 [Amphibalanus amphitrite]